MEPLESLERKGNMIRLGSLKGTISSSEEWWMKNIEENMHFKAFQDEGIELELEYKMEQLSRVSVSQRGCYKVINFTPGEHEKETIYIPSPPNYNVGNAPYDCDDVMRSKRGSENDASRSNKSSKTESSRRVGGSAMLMEKLDVMVRVFIERSIKYMELMNLEAHTLVDSSHTLVDSLAKLVSLPSSISTTPEFCFACILIEDPQKRKILNDLQDDDARLYWIKYLNDREK
ncbi:hypothetical protein Gotri_018800 [Gossypium trilobum]|uniref:Uncharacterized protein n=1 Tax=Gossypium trilobum TaxID=34281 RepID=A0A7J9EAU5_9ROSI|nr:hypothetical protein [Gossypium trilobum]